MLANTRYIVIFKDSPADRNRYFGPFVSDTLAQRFMDELPAPLEGGLKTWKALSPYNHDEVSLAAQVILRRRDPNGLFSVGCEIVAPRQVA